MTTKPKAFERPTEAPDPQPLAEDYPNFTAPQETEPEVQPSQPAPNQDKK